MNPFVNPNKRSVILPEGCKNLVPVPKPQKNKEIKTIRRIIYSLLFQAQRDRASEMIIGVAMPYETPVRYNVEGTWHDRPLLSEIRAAVVVELARMAGFPPGRFSGEGCFEVGYAGLRFNWTVKITSVEEECVLYLMPD